MRPLLAVSLLLALAGCGASATGNELGGVMPWSGQSPESAFKAAETHCGKAHKHARITQIVPPTKGAEGAVVFNCE
ncbi:MAG: hypothetical protein JSS04_04270 [Proteobacteria bacterium]|nr:hypothetical protein [Pseudomonadota bacterium]